MVMRTPRRQRHAVARTWVAVSRAISLAAVLGLTLLVVPDSRQATTEASLVKVERSQGVDLSPEVIWIAAIGSDARPWENMTTTRGDALQLVGLNTRTGAATAFGVPRDSWVQIPGRGQDRINAAMTIGGPQLQARVLGDLFGIEPDYVFVTRFEGMEKMLGAVGPITVKNPYAFSDVNLRPQGYAAGEIELGRYGAMNYARIRKGLTDGDFGRSANQQRVLRGIHRAVADQRNDAGFIEKGALAVLKHTDTDAAPTEIFRIAQAAAQVRSSRITTCVVPGSIGMAGAASVVFPDTATARRWGAEASKDATLQGC